MKTEQEIKDRIKKHQAEFEATPWQGGIFRKLGLTDLVKELEWVLEGATIENKKPNLSTCPGCGGDADNGHDRCVPPSPYYCSQCYPPRGKMEEF